MSDKIYIAGPMQGIADFNFPAFHEAARMLRDAGYIVFSPAEKDEQTYGKEMNKSATGDLKDANEKGFSLRHALQVDTEWIALNADAIYMLTGWENSKGAFAEWALARALSLKILYE